jgi:hypothetical protein
MVARIRRLLCARTEVWTPAWTHRELSNAYWRKHGALAKIAEFLRKSILLDFGVDAPHAPESFYHKF